jgi:hypothetical protein
MQPAIRTQVDGLNEEYSLLTGLDCSNLPDMARQEFKAETDVNIILGRYGIDGIQRPTQYAQVDYDMDLQQSLESIREAERAVMKLPPELREKYRTWEGLLDGVYNGQLKTDLATYHAAKEAEAAQAAAKEALDKSGAGV